MAFGRLARTGKMSPMADINVTPLVDVMLVLLVIFMLTAPLMTSKIRLDLPRASVPAAGANAAPKFVTLSLTPAGQVFLDDHAIASVELPDAFARIAQANRNTEVQIRADQSVPYGRVAEAMAHAHRAGLTRLGFVTDPSSAKATPAVPADPTRLPGGPAPR